ncbi:dipeptidase [Thermostilla marina]
MPTFEEYVAGSHDRFDAVLIDFLKIPSVSAASEHASDMEAAAAWLRTFFDEIGFSVEIVRGEGHPIVVARSPKKDDRPTVLVYGHYDVQPPEPLELWASPPFEPQVRDGAVYARGACDNKGQILTHMLSVRSMLETEGDLPVNVIFVVEGEEEIGSHLLEKYLDEHAAELACDYVVVSDSAQFGPGQPAITCGLRGIAYFELRLRGAKRDLHSGTFGGGVTNPANVLVEMLASMRNPDGSVAVPGFYDDVVPLSDKEREQFASLPFDEQAYFAELEVNGATGEKGYTILERRWARPSYDVNGLDSGYQGEGAKTVIPNTAVAKFSFRLVPNQQPDRVYSLVKEHLQRRCPPGVTMELLDLHGSPGVLVSMDSPGLKAASAAIERAFGKAPVYTREGGSIPIVARFQQRLGVDVLLLGWAQDDDNAHAPNEKFRLDDYHKAIMASGFLWREIAARAKT